MNSALTVQQLASVLVKTACDMGFNAVRVAEYYHLASDTKHLAVTFGDRKTLMLTSIAPTSVLCWLEDFECTRPERTFLFDNHDLKYKRADEIQDYFAGELLELAP